MNIHQIAIWVIYLSCGLIIVGAIEVGDRKGWLAIAVMILLVTTALLYFAPKLASLVGGALWLILLILPSWLLRSVNRLVYQQKYGRARRLAEILRFLHPADGLGLYPKLLRSLEIAQSGNMEVAKESLGKYQEIKTAQGRYVTIALYKMDGQWEELLAWMRDRIPEKLRSKDRELMINYLRALGETGDVNGLVGELKLLEQLTSKSRDLVSLNTVRMISFAFCGEIDLVKSLLQHQLRVFSPEISQFWIATAEIAAGMELKARERFASLDRSADISLQKAIARRLSHSSMHSLNARELSLDSKQILIQLKSDIQQEARYGAIVQSGKKAYATYGLIGLNLLMFAVQMATGKTDNIENLYRLGGLLPISVWQGEWWRLLSSTFLHANILHISLNMMGLYALGEFVEITLGIRKYLVAYFFSGLGSMLFITIITVFFGFPPKITIGASGAIMGIIGATGAILLKGWLSEKSQVAAKRLRAILLMVGFQIIFDLSTPQVSAVAHASGLTLGFLITLFLFVNPQRIISR
jgi:rhomboid protease GluP